MDYCGHGLGPPHFCMVRNTPGIGLPVGTTRRDTALKVLIADDSQLVLDGLRHALGGVADIEVVGAAASGAHVLDLIERRRPEIVAIDVHMRTAEGRNCLDAIRE